MTDPARGIRGIPKPGSRIRDAELHPAAKRTQSRGGEGIRYEETSRFLILRSVLLDFREQNGMD